MGGVLITPVEKDFEGLDEADVEDIYREVSLEEKRVGLVVEAMGLVPSGNELSGG
jgi:hypothetical protein